MFGVKSNCSNALIIKLSVMSVWNMKQALYNVMMNTATGIIWYVPLHELRYSDFTSGKYTTTAVCVLF